MKIIKRAGETIKMERSVLNSDTTPADLTDAIAKFKMINQTSGKSEVIEKDCVITGNVLSITLDSADTAVSGRYRYEFRVKLFNEEASIDSGIIVLKTALLQGL